MSNIPTPHIACQKEDFAETVIMPGDPLRSKFIAETFLENPVLINNVRGVQGYTGTYKGKRVSVMASGMGMPSIGIYSHELFNFYDVKNIIRVGTAGSLQEHIKLKDVTIAMASVTNSNWTSQFKIDAQIPAVCSFELLQKAVKAAEDLGITAHVGTMYSSDIFYDESGTEMKLKELGVMGVEMESAALYYEAMKAGKNALCLCTISDDIITGAQTTPEERQTTFTKMMEIALEIA